MCTKNVYKCVPKIKIRGVGRTSLTGSKGLGVGSTLAQGPPCHRGRGPALFHQFGRRGVRRGNWRLGLLAVQYNRVGVVWLRVLIRL